MKKYTGVKGTMEKVPNLEVTATTVYIRSNIKEVDINGVKGWQYDEIQYSLSEYQEDVGNRTEILEADTNAVAELVATTVVDSLTSAEMLAVMIEDTAQVSEMLAALLEKNALLTARIEQLEGVEKVNG